MTFDITWEGNQDGSRRILLLTPEALPIWVQIVAPNGGSPRVDFELKARIRGGVWSWLEDLRVHTPKERGLFASRVEEGAQGFYIKELPRACLPYRIEFEAENDRVSETTLLYVVPQLSRYVSRVACLLIVVCAAYTSWLFLSLSSEDTPTSFVTIVGTVAGVLSPLLGFAPFVSTTVRRLALNALTSTAGLLITLSITYLVHRAQAPVYIENNTPIALDTIANNRHIVIEPGSSVIVPRSRLDSGLRAQIDDIPGGTPRSHWFTVGNFCLGEGATGKAAQAKSRSPHTADQAPSSGECVRWRAVSWTSRLQRWLALGENYHIGCQSKPGMPPDIERHWQESGSCAFDPEIEIVHDLHQSLARSIDPPVDAETGAARSAQNGEVAAPSKPGSPHFVCPRLRTEVRYHPFRPDADGQVDPRSFNVGTNGSESDLRQVRVRWPSSAQRSSSLPTWTLKGEGKVAQVRMTLPKGTPQSTEHQACDVPYSAPCSNPQPKNGICSVLYAPQGPLAATLHRGDQLVGELWCAPGRQQVFALRVRSRLRSLRILREYGTNPNRLDQELLSHFDARTSEPADWAFWCEPTQQPAGPDGASANKGKLKAVVTLANDWQPTKQWVLEVASGSALELLEVRVEGQGLWGTLQCPVQGDQARVVSLLEVGSAAGVGVREATGAGTKWVRYSETTLYPRWVWRCGESLRLDVRLTNGRKGYVDMDGNLTESVGVACLIDRRTKRRVGQVGVDGPGDESEGAKRAVKADLERWRQPGCDAGRSRYRVKGEP